MIPLLMLNLKIIDVEELSGQLKEILATKRSFEKKRKNTIEVVEEKPSALIEGPEVYS